MWVTLELKPRYGLSRLCRVEPETGVKCTYRQFGVLFVNDVRDLDFTG